MQKIAVWLLEESLFIGVPLDQKPPGLCGHVG